MRMSEGADSANVPTNTTSQRQSRRNNLNDARAISRANSKLPASPLTESPNRISGAHLEVQQDHGYAVLTTKYDFLGIPGRLG